MDPEKFSAESAIAESCFLGVFIQGDSDRSEMIGLVQSPEMLAAPKHRLIYEVILKLYGEGKSIEPVTIDGELKRTQKSELAGGLDYIMSLLHGIPDIYGGLIYAQEVKDFWQRRKLLAIVDKLALDIRTSRSEDVATLSNRMMDIFAARGERKQMSHFGDLLPIAMDSVKFTESPVITKIAKIDGNINLFIPGEVTVVAGRPGSGKSTFMRQLVTSAAESAPKDGVVLCFPLEVDDMGLTQQIMCETANVPFEAWRRGVATEDQQKRLAELMGDAYKLPIDIYGSTAVSTLDISIAINRSIASGKKPILVVIDYLGLVEHGKAERNDLEIAKTTRAVKQLALQKNVPIMLLAQLNRESEKRGTDAECDRPRLADLRDSGSIEQDADNVVFIWRRNRGDQFKTVEERTITIAKHRNGPVFEMDLMFAKDRGRFYEVSNQGVPV